MDLETFPFSSEKLNQVRHQFHEIRVLNCPAMVIGASGSGKSSWAQELTKSYPAREIVDSHTAPKAVREWKSLFLHLGARGLILENLDRWGDATQSALFHYLRTEGLPKTRIISTAHARIHSQVNRGEFRSDLFYRLSTRTLHLPNVRECLADLSAIAGFWIKVHGLVSGLQDPRLLPEALLELEKHDWPGGWAELVMVLERALTFGTEIVDGKSLQFEVGNSQESFLQAGLTLAEMEKNLILQTLKITSKNKSQAARILGISIRTLRNKLNEYKQESVHELI